MSTPKVPLEQITYTNVDRQKVLRALKPGVHENEPLRRNSLKSGRVFNDVQHQSRSGSRSNVPVLPSLRSGSLVQNNKRRASDAAGLLQNSNLSSALHYRSSEEASGYSPHISSLYLHRPQNVLPVTNYSDPPSVSTTLIAGQSTPRTTERSSLKRISEGYSAGVSSSPRIQPVHKTPIQQPLTPINFSLPGPRYSRSRATSGSSSGSSTCIRKYKYNPPSIGDQSASLGSSDNTSMAAAATVRTSPLTSLVSSAMANCSPELQVIAGTPFGSVPKEKEQVKRSSTTITKRCAYGKPLVTIDDICEVDRMFHTLETPGAIHTTSSVIKESKGLPSTADSRSSIDQVKALRLNLVGSSDSSNDNDPAPILTGNARSKSCTAVNNTSEYLTIFLGARKG